MRGLTNGIEFLFKKNKVEYIKGSATLETDHVISTQLLGGGERKIEATNIILATGSGRLVCLCSCSESSYGSPSRGQRQGAHHRQHGSSEAEQGARASDRGGRRSDRSGAGVGVAPSGLEGGGGGVPGPHRRTERQRDLQHSAAMSDEAGNEVQAEHEGDGQRAHRRGREGERGGQG